MFNIQHVKVHNLGNFKENNIIIEAKIQQLLLYLVIDNYANFVPYCIRIAFSVYHKSIFKRV